VSIFFQYKNHLVRRAGPTTNQYQPPINPPIASIESGTVSGVLKQISTATHKNNKAQAIAG
jgi:hypothetical protein